jgi:SAM-dependent methyltransferase
LKRFWRPEAESDSSRRQAQTFPMAVKENELPSYRRNLGKVSYTYKDVGAYGVFMNTCRLAAWKMAIERFGLDRSRVLDVGCSYGSWFENWRQLGFAQLVGVEPNPVAYKAASEIYDEVYCVFGAELRKHFTNQRTVAANGVLVHILEPTETVTFLRDVSATLAENGYFLYSVVNARFYYSSGRKERVGENSCVRMLETQRNYARKAGLTICAEIGTFIDPWALPELEFLATWTDRRDDPAFYRPFVDISHLLRGKSVEPFSEVLLVAQRRRP